MDEPRKVRICPVCLKPWDDKHREGMVGFINLIGCPLMPRGTMLLIDLAKHDS